MSFGRAIPKGIEGRLWQCKDIQQITTAYNSMKGSVEVSASKCVQHFRLRHSRSSSAHTEQSEDGKIKVIRCRSPFVFETDGASGLAKRRV